MSVHQYQCTMMAPLYTCGMSSPWGRGGRAGPASGLASVQCQQPSLAEAETTLWWPGCGHRDMGEAGPLRHTATVLLLWVNVCLGVTQLTSEPPVSWLSVSLLKFKWFLDPDLRQFRWQQSAPSYPTQSTWRGFIKWKVETILLCLVRYLLAETRKGVGEGWGEGSNGLEINTLFQFIMVIPYWFSVDTL